METPGKRQLLWLNHILPLRHGNRKFTRKDKKILSESLLEKRFSIDEINNISSGSLLSLGKLEIDIRNLFDVGELKAIRDLIKNNLGDSKLIIFYGAEQNPKILECEIQINQEVINGLKKYLIIN
jgi:hypothetical protein